MKHKQVFRAAYLTLCLMSLIHGQVLNATLIASLWVFMELTQ